MSFPACRPRSPWSRSARATGCRTKQRRSSVATKVALIEALAEAGLPAIEAGVFVSPEMGAADGGHAPRCWRGLRRKPGRALSGAGARTSRGWRRRWPPAPARSRCSAPPPRPSRSKNINCSIDESLARFAAGGRASALAAGLRVRGYVSCVLGCPYEGEIAPGGRRRGGAQARRDGLLRGLARRHDRHRHAAQGRGVLSSGSASDVPLRASGAAFPRHLRPGLGQRARLPRDGRRRRRQRGRGPRRLPLRQGCDRAIVATEDVVYMLDGMGIETGVDLDGVIRAGAAICDALGRSSGSKVALARRG